MLKNKKCVSCGKDCYGKRCRKCHGKNKNSKVSKMNKTSK